MDDTAGATVAPLTTNELIGLVLAQPGRWLEAALILQMPFLAVHFLCFDGSTLWDEGVDGEQSGVTPEHFATQYAGQFWQLQQVV